MSQTTLKLLGQSALLPAAAAPVVDDPQLAIDFDTPVVARTLSGQLDSKPEGMQRWNRLDRYGRAVAGTCDAAIRRQLLADGPETGLYLASLYSCLEVNAEFDEGLITKGPERASPFVFPYTLPGSCGSEVAMLLGLRGPYVVLPGGPATALGCVVAAADSIEEGLAERLVVTAADVLGPATVRSIEAAGEVPDKDEPPIAEAAASLWLAPADDPAPAPTLAIEATLAAPTSEAEALARLMREALMRAQIAPAEITHAVSATSSLPYHRSEGEALATVSDAELLHLVWRTGNCGAALGLLAVQAALEQEGPALVLATDHGASVVMVVAA